MFRFFVKLMALIVVLALAGPFFIRGPDGQPLLSFGDVKLQLSAAGHDIATGWNRLTTRFGHADEPLPVYRWKDADGNWHYSDAANPAGESELIYIDPDKNVIPGIDIPNTQATSVRSVQAKPANGIQIKNLNPAQILNDARDAAKTMEERNAEIRERADEER
ncbi:MAG: DUF4124 domain-containing protein [Gammaproteobacteria bacterium]|nr:DUF4124 domain-containing protein [Gammaproteobacteria bacterium]